MRQSERIGDGRRWEKMEIAGVEAFARDGQDSSKVTLHK